MQDWLSQQGVYNQSDEIDMNDKNDKSLNTTEQAAERMAELMGVYRIDLDNPRTIEQYSPEDVAEYERIYNDINRQEIAACLEYGKNRLATLQQQREQFEKEQKLNREVSDMLSMQLEAAHAQVAKAYDSLVYATEADVNLGGKLENLMVKMVHETMVLDFESWY